MSKQPDALADVIERDGCCAHRKETVAELRRLHTQVERLHNLINTPHTDVFVDAVRLEAAHQQERWGTSHDEGKAPADWFWLLGYLGGKALAAFVKGDVQKGRHHIISSAAALLNWHRHATGEMTAMRPGIDALGEGEKK